MKKFFVSILLVVGLFSFTVQAADRIPVSPKIQNAFQEEFKGASAVRWESLDGDRIYHATFIFHDQQLNAFFDNDGNLIATGRDITAGNLPLLVAKSINDRFCGYEIKNIAEYSAEGETSYVLTLENEKSKLIVRAYDTGSSVIFKKERK